MKKSLGFNFIQVNKKELERLKVIPKNKMEEELDKLIADSYFFKENFSERATKDIVNSNYLVSATNSPETPVLQYVLEERIDFQAASKCTKFKELVKWGVQENLRIFLSRNTRKTILSIFPYDEELYGPPMD